jgi:hypothetical protein
VQDVIHAVKQNVHARIKKTVGVGNDAYFHMLKVTGGQ